MNKEQETIALWQSKGIVNFKPHEFDSPDKAGTGCLMNIDFMMMLQKVRDFCGFGLSVNSGARTKDRNKKVGGADLSSHRTDTPEGPCAADIRYRSAYQLFMIVIGGYLAGFRRFGIGFSFVHLDSDTRKNPKRMWTYYKGKATAKKAQAFIRKLSGKVEIKSVEDWDR